MKNTEIGLAPYVFTDKEKAAFRATLYRYGAEKVDTFLKHLSYICNQGIHLKNTESIQKMKKNTAPMLANFRESVRLLKQLKRAYIDKDRGVVFLHYDQIGGKDSFSPEDRNINSMVFRIMARAEPIENELSDLIEEIEVQLTRWTNKNGRPSADNGKFCLKIAEIFYECFHELPTTYRDGPFYKVINKALEAVGFPYKAPDRSVIEAVKQVKEQADSKD